MCRLYSVFAYPFVGILFLPTINHKLHPWMDDIMLLILVNALTGSTAAIATLTILLAIPQVTIGLLGGVFADRWDRKRIILASDLVRGGAGLSTGRSVVVAATLVWSLPLNINSIRLAPL